MSNSEDWEEKLIEQMSEMFRNMGMPIDKDQLRKLMEQFRGQFEEMGIDAEKIAKGEVNFNFDFDNCRDFLNRENKFSYPRKK